MSIHTASGFTTSDAVIAAINVGTPENGISATYRSGDSYFYIKYNSKTLMNLLWASSNHNYGFRVGAGWGNPDQKLYVNNGNSGWEFDREISTPQSYDKYAQIKVTTTAKGLYLYYYLSASSGDYATSVWITIDRNGNPQYLVTNDRGGTTTKYRQTLAYNLTIDKKINYEPTINDTTSTSIANCCAAGDVGQYTVMDNLFFYVCRQYPNEGIIEMNGDLYYTNGTYLLLDGPME
jgi:hypothetical protein